MPVQQLQKVKFFFVSTIRILKDVGTVMDLLVIGLVVMNLLMVGSVVMNVGMVGGVVMNLGMVGSVVMNLGMVGGVVMNLWLYVRNIDDGMVFIFDWFWLDRRPVVGF